MQQRNRFRPERFRVSVGAICGGLLVIALWMAGMLERPEAIVRDEYVRLLENPVPSDLAIIEIDARSIGEIGRWPWPRSLYAEAADALRALGAASVSIDIDLSAISSNIEDERLTAALTLLARSSEVRLPVFLQYASQTDRTLILRKPMAAVSNVVTPVSVTMQPEQDGLVRFLSSGFSWEGVDYAGAWNAMVGRPGQATWIDFSIAPESFTYFSFIDLVQGRIPADALRGRNVFIGATAIELGDNISVPVHQVLPGVIVQALGAATLEQGGLFRLNDIVGLLLLISYWLVAALTLGKLNWRRSLALMLGMIIVSLAVAITAYVRASLIIDVLAPVLMWFSVFVAVNLARLDSVSLERFWLQLSLRDSEQVLDRIVFTANDCIVCVDASGTVTRINPAAARLVGVTQEKSQVCLFNYLPELGSDMATLPSEPFDTRAVTADGRSIPVEITVSLVKLSTAPLFTVVLRDLSERVAREEALQYRATHDALTGLLNRSEFFRRVNTLLQHADTDKSSTLLTLDIDYFREVNDTYGHDVGDELLIAVGARLAADSAARSIESLTARVGANDFALWLSCPLSVDPVVATAALVDRVFDLAFEFEEDGGAQIQISATAGIVVLQPGKAGEQPVVDAESLLRKAADALRMARRDGLGVRVYSEADGHAASRRLELVPAIREAIRTSEFELVYQPKIDLRDFSVYGSEALLRWPRRSGEFVRVDTLIEVAESSRQIAPLTAWVVERVLQQEAEWARRGLPPHIAINLSAKLFQDKTFMAGLKDLLASSSGYYQFEFEMTETALSTNPQQTIQMIGELLESGCSLAIDDFGTGYSSLAYLRDLRANVLKIDRSFVTDIDSRPEHQAIVRSTVRMAHDLGLKVVAEGIETVADQIWLCNIGCDIGQGYYYAKPLSLDAFSDWCKTRESIQPYPPREAALAGGRAHHGISLRHQS